MRLVGRRLWIESLAAWGRRGVCVSRLSPKEVALHLQAWARAPGVCQVEFSMAIGGGLL
jgi:hypothetical protein